MRNPLAPEERAGLGWEKSEVAKENLFRRQLKHKVFIM